MMHASLRLASGVESLAFGVDPDSRGQKVGSYRGSSLIRNNLLLGPYRRPMPRVLGGSYGGRIFLMSEVPLLCLPLRRLLGGGVVSGQD